jgi:hypothetical protein
MMLMGLRRFTKNMPNIVALEKLLTKLVYRKYILFLIVEICFYVF